MAENNKQEDQNGSSIDENTSGQMPANIENLESVNGIESLNSLGSPESNSSSGNCSSVSFAKMSESNNQQDQNGSSIDENTSEQMPANIENLESVNRIESLNSLGSPESNSSSGNCSSACFAKMSESNNQQDQNGSSIDESENNKQEDQNGPSIDENTSGQMPANIENLESVNRIESLNSLGSPESNSSSGNCSSGNCSTEVLVDDKIEANQSIASLSNSNQEIESINDEQPTCSGCQANSECSLAENQSNQGTLKRKCEEEDSSPEKWRRVTCGICRESCIDKSTTATRCGHLFCAACIKEWIGTKKECPVCQTKCTLRSLFRIYLF